MITITITAVVICPWIPKWDKISQDIFMDREERKADSDSIIIVSEFQNSRITGPKEYKWIDQWSGRSLVNFSEDLPLALCKAAF